MSGIQARIAATRGAFRISNAAQQFGEGNPVVKELKKNNEQNKQLIDGVDKLQKAFDKFDGGRLR